MKKILVIIISLFLMPIIVNAETLQYNICKNGCEYSSFDEIRNHSNGILNEVGEEVFSTYDVIINFKDGETYEEEDFEYYPVNNLIINGNSAKIISRRFTIYYTNKITLENLDITTEIVEFAGKFDETRIGNPEYNEYKNSIININNCTIKATDTDSIMFIGGTFYISNTSFSGYNIFSLLSDVNMRNTSLSPSFLLVGYADYFPVYDTNVYLNLNDLKKNKKIIRCLYNEVGFGELLTKHPELNDLDEGLDIYLLFEFPLKEEYITNGITKTNNIFIKQDVSKTIKTNTSISEFESEFVNTYEDSFGYDDIKDLPIEWKSENESIATLDNGTIKPIANGQVDLVGTRGNDIYTIHLTVDMTAKKTIEKKGKMAPSTKITVKSVFKDSDITSVSDDVWEISNPSIAKIVNGEIISLQKGETDIVATINGVKYIYHLTVSDTLVSKEIKVPITGENIKLWVVVATTLLLSVIGACTYILLKNKKAE